MRSHWSSVLNKKGCLRTSWHHQQPWGKLFYGQSHAGHVWGQCLVKRKNNNTPTHKKQQQCFHLLLPGAGNKTGRYGSRCEQHFSQCSSRAMSWFDFWTRLQTTLQMYQGEPAMYCDCSVTAVETALRTSKSIIESEVSYDSRIIILTQSFKNITAICLHLTNLKSVIWQQLLCFDFLFICCTSCFWDWEAHCHPGKK